MSKFWEFFQDKTAQSMMRLISFSATVVVVILSLFSMYLAATDSFSWEYGMFILSILAAAIGGKNWAKNIELKKNSNGES